MGVLWRWCQMQRKKLRDGKLMPSREQTLDASGFPWRM